MKEGALGRLYHDGEVIFRQGDAGNSMYVILEGKVEVYLERDGREVPIKLAKEGEFLGVRALFGNEGFTTSARARGNSRLLTIDKRNFMRRIQEDPTIAYRLVQELSNSVRELEQDVAVLSNALRESMGKLKE